MSTTIPAVRRSESRRSRGLPSWWAFVAGLVALASAVVLVARSADPEGLRRAWSAMVSDPVGITLALGAFAFAFAIRAGLWQRMLPGLGYGQSLAAIHLSLGANHVLPLRLGEPVRVLSVVRRTAIPLEPATASTITLRSADVLAVLVVGWLAAPEVLGRLGGPWTWIAAALVLLVGAAGLAWTQHLRRKGRNLLRLPGPAVAAGTMGAWLCEAVLVWQCAHWAGLPLNLPAAVVVTTVAVSAQIVAIAPGGVGTYEAATVAAFTALGYDPAAALSAAVLAHGLTTAYSLVTGALAVFLPEPSILGNLRLASRDRSVRGEAPARPEPAWVSVVLPAHDEEATVGEVVRRAPHTVCGVPVAVTVVDDGSSDATVPRARSAGARVISFPRNQGLGAAVRFGLADAAARGAAAVAFLDADGEYDPAELELLIAPILRGEADYVVGSRFAGWIERMHPHRRLGNRLLSKLLSAIARCRISDGQSGFRALSGRAAADAEIIHDFNYAQVLTLDLLAKGYRYEEVPITYGFRTTGRSFIRPASYLRRVIPAIYRELNEPSPVLAPGP